mmetsp:Transcript_2185/g.6154  ORF Transcript_2185/g.6154 Transcript_2185/m.6154 type:complete len:213 (+) Transcript_2185:787-1425(+)
MRHDAALRAGWLIGTRLAGDGCAIRDHLHHAVLHFIGLVAHRHDASGAAQPGLLEHAVECLPSCGAAERRPRPDLAPGDGLEPGAEVGNGVAGAHGEAADNAERVGCRKPWQDACGGDHVRRQAPVQGRGPWLAACRAGHSRAVGKHLGHTLGDLVGVVAHGQHTIGTAFNSLRKHPHISLLPGILAHLREGLDLATHEGLEPCSHGGKHVS